MTVWFNRLENAMNKSLSRDYLVGILGLCLAVLISGCTAAPETTLGKRLLNDKVKVAIEAFRGKYPEYASLFHSAYGYAVLPSVKEIALGIGGAGGNGEVFKDGNLIGYCSVGEGSIGGQIGGQAYAEYVFFQNKYTLENFKHGASAFDARVSAIAGQAGVGKAVNYRHGVIVLIKPKVGLMAQAAVGVQHFRFHPLHE